VIYPGRMARGNTTLDSWLTSILEKAPTKVRPQKIEPITSEELKKVFPDDEFYAISFATWPRPPSLPQELSTQMIARVRQGTVAPLRNMDDLAKYLGGELPQARGDEQIRTVMLASLRLAEPVARAGAYEFAKPALSVTRANLNLEATASASVAEPARGDVTVSMEFTKEGNVLPGSIRIEDRTRAGPPP
jgi:hypothetical protein